VGVGGAAGRLVQFRQLQRRSQAEAARALLARNGDGGEEGLLGGRGVVGTDLQQDVAANACRRSLAEVVTAEASGGFGGLFEASSKRSRWHRIQDTTTPKDRDR
jgi:hypothetical protein